MGDIKRYVAGLPLAGVATGGLFLLMIGLVRTEFAPQAVAEVEAVELAPVVEDMEVLRRRTLLEPQAAVKTPPAPPRIATPSANAPTTPIVKVAGGLPELDPVMLDIGPVTMNIPDRDVQPLVRVPPVMPANAERSGHCNVRFDVSPDGAPFNVEAVSCSSNVFRRATVRSVQRWKYQPKITDGLAVGRSGVENRVSFRLVDERGAVIPE